MRLDMQQQLPKKVTMVEILLRDGLQHATKVIPTETKLWFADQFIRAGYEVIEVTNFSHPRLLPQTRDAEDLLKRMWELEAVKEGKVHLKCYGMTKRAFERAAQSAQAGYSPHTVAFTISAEDLHGRRNSGRTREEYFQDIPGFVKIARGNGFDIDMAIACVYGSPCAGPVPIENTIDLMEQGLDLGIRNFTPCDTTGECNPLRAYEYMSALVDRFGKHDEVKFRVAHFHEARGMSIANTVAAIMAGARVVETSLGSLGGQPAFMVDDVPGIGTGPIYTNSCEVGNASTEDVLVALDEMGIGVGVDIDKMLQLGRVLEWVLGQSLHVWTTKAGRPIRQPVEWNIPENNLAYVPPYGTPEIYWADPSRYKPASASFIAKEFEGRKLRWDPWEDKVKDKIKTTDDR
jgi:hydroxymethylglutaryl-CoA lyase